MKKRKRKFWLVWLIYTTILAVLIVLLWNKVWSIMKEYEAAQPDYVVEELLDQLSKGTYLGKMIISENKYEPADTFLRVFQEQIRNEELTYQTENSGERMVYGIYAGGDKVASATLAGRNERPMMMILSVFDWDVEKVEVKAREGSKKVHVEVPDGYQVAVNGVLLSDAERTGGPVPMPGMGYVAEYVDVPVFYTYEVDGLVMEPTVDVWDVENNKVELSEIADASETAGWSVYGTVSFTPQEMPEGLSDYVIKVAKDYSNFFSRDLAGAEQSTAGLQPYFPAGSYYIDLAEDYRRHDMWMYSNHSAPEFQNVEVTEYIPYNEQCFSCRVIFDKSMYLVRTGDTRVEHNDQTYFYVNLNGKWVIADIRSNDNNG